MARELQIVKRDEVDYWVKPVHTNKTCVGLSPVKVRKDLDEILADFSSEAITEFVNRQLITDAENAVRGKYNRDKVNATTVINLIGTGALTPEMQDIANKDWQSDAPGHSKDFTAACAKLLGLGKDALKNANPKQIHWDCVK